MQANLLRFDKSKKLVFLDMETENLCLYAPQNLPWQVSMLKVIGNDVVEEADFFVKWHRPPKVSADAARITRFDPNNIINHGVDYRDVVKTTVKWTSEADYILGHNILGFDIYLLIHFYNLLGKSTDGLAEKMIDTHALIKGLKLGQKFDRSTTTLAEYQYRMINTIVKGVKTNMTTVGKEFEIEHDYETLHNSLNDLKLNLKIWNKVKWQMDI